MDYNNISEDILTNIFSPLLAPSSPPCPLSISPFLVCKRWHSILTQQPFFISLLRTHYPSFPYESLKDGNNARNAYNLLKSTIYINTSFCTNIPGSELMTRMQYQKETILKKYKNANEIDYLLDQFIYAVFCTTSTFDLFLLRQRNYILYGPEGCGKRSFVETLAQYFAAELVVVEYQMLRKMETKESLVFIKFLEDFIQASSSTRIIVQTLEPQGKYNTTTCAFVSYLDGCPDKVANFVTTKDPKNVDSSVARRLRSTRYFDVPSTEEREDFLRNLLPLSTSLIHSLAELTNNFTYKDLELLCKQEGLNLETNPQEAIATFKCQYSPQDIYKLKNFDPQMLNAAFLSMWDNFGDTKWEWDRDGVRISDN